LLEESLVLLNAVHVVVDSKPALFVLFLLFVVGLSKHVAAKNVDDCDQLEIKVEYEGLLVIY